MLREEIRRALASLQVVATESQVDALHAHASMMLDANAVHNLTRITDAHDVAFLHVADSLTALPVLSAAQPGPFADLGSGAGYPGVPLAIMSGRCGTLVESRAKKAAFLQDVARVIGLDLQVLPERAEEAARGHAGAFSVVTARALSSLPSIVELAAPLLAPGGVFIAMKGGPAGEELEAGDRVARMVGLERSSAEAFLLPVALVRRTLVCYRRTGDARIALPRRPGMAQRSPLA